jgi:uncharacterized RDD family membrane protein YckC
MISPIMFTFLMVSASDSAAAKVSVINRVLAKLIDIALVMLLAAALPYPVGPLLGFLYSLAADGMNFWKFEGQSVGKFLMKLKVVSLTREQAPPTCASPCSGTLRSGWRRSSRSSRSGAG